VSEDEGQGAQTPDDAVEAAARETADAPADVAPEAEPAPAEESVPEPEAGPEPVPAPAEEPEPEPEAVREPAEESDVEPAPEPVSEPEAAPAPVSESGVEPAPAPDAEPASEPEAVPASVEKSAREPILRTMLTAMLGAAPIAVGITDEEGNFEEVNVEYEKVYGYSPDEMVGRHFTIVIPPEERVRLTRLHDRLIADGARMRGTFQAITKDRQRRTVQVSACRVTDEEGLRHKVTFVVDITDRTRLEADLAKANERLAHLATHDSLTGLPNHRRSRELLIQAVEIAERYERDLSVAVIDLDGFKQVNDAFGHLEGDRIIVQFTRLLQAQLRAVDSAGRLGGEEFLVVMPETPTEGGCTMLERMGVTCWDHLRTPSGQPVRFSGGVVGFTPHELPESVLRRAEEALRRAKEAGRDRVVVG
jgi:diguanylate cyclase (GGDEF)-like protein/PAS domain S-box-containing protein